MHIKVFEVQLYSSSGSCSYFANKETRSRESKDSLQVSSSWCQSQDKNLTLLLRGQCGHCPSCLLSSDDSGSPSFSILPRPILGTSALHSIGNKRGFKDSSMSSFSVSPKTIQFSKCRLPNFCNEMN